MAPLNSPLEVGVRLLVVLDAIFPKSLDLSELTVCDYRLLHSGEMGGPPSIHPQLPISPGELGMKRGLIKTGLQVMMRAGMVSVETNDRGIYYQATDQARGFIRVLESRYVESLQERVPWTIQQLDAHHSDDGEYVSRILHSWDNTGQNYEHGDRT